MSNGIGGKLRQLRQSKKWTQEEVSAKLDYTISRSTLSNYEIERRTPHLRDLQKLAKVYGVGLDYFDISVRDETFELIARAREVFDSPIIPSIEKEELYQEFMKMYLAMKGNENK